MCKGDASSNRIPTGWTSVEEVNIMSRFEELFVDRSSQIEFALGVEDIGSGDWALCMPSFSGIKCCASEEGKSSESKRSKRSSTPEPSVKKEWEERLAKVEEALKKFGEACKKFSTYTKQL